MEGFQVFLVIGELQVGAVFFLKLGPPVPDYHNGEKHKRNKDRDITAV